MLVCNPSGCIVKLPKRHKHNISNLTPGTKNKMRYHKISSNSREKLIYKALIIKRNAKYTCKTFILTYRKGKSPDVATAKKQAHRLIEYIKKKYGYIKYVYTMELTKSGTIHFHFISDMPYIPVKILNNLWCVIRKDMSDNAVRHVRNIRNYAAGMLYMSKYISKTKEYYDKLKGHRLFGYSNHIDTLKKTILTDISFIENYKEKISKIIVLREDTYKLIFFFIKKQFFDEYFNLMY